MRLVSVCSVVLAVLLAAAPARAQADPALRRVVLTDGTVLVGTVADEGADPVVVASTDGVERRIPRARVAEITPLIEGRFFRLDPTRTRTVFSPTARTIGRGKTRLGLLSVVLPNVTYGITDRVDFSGTGFLTFGDGATLLPLLGVKATVFETPSAAFALGTSVAIPIGGDVTGAFVALPYGVVTLGGDVRSVSLGLTGAVGGDIASEAGDNSIAFGDGVAVSVGGELQVNNGVKLLAEAIVPFTAGDEGAREAFFFPGVRFFGDQFSVDVFGVVAVVDDGLSTGDGADVFGFAPLANFTYTF